MLALKQKRKRSRISGGATVVQVGEAAMLRSWVDKRRNADLFNRLNRITHLFDQNTLEKGESPYVALGTQFDPYVEGLLAEAKRVATGGVARPGFVQTNEQVAQSAETLQNPRRHSNYGWDGGNFIWDASVPLVGYTPSIMAATVFFYQNYLIHVLKYPGLHEKVGGKDLLSDFLFYVDLQSFPTTGVVRITNPITNPAVPGYGNVVGSITARGAILQLNVILSTPRSEIARSVSIVISHLAGYHGNAWRNGDHWGRLPSFPNIELPNLSPFADAGTLNAKYTRAGAVDAKIFNSSALSMMAT